jgi:hypothetical protein
MVGDWTSSTTVFGTGGGLGPVRTLEGRICSKPCSLATFSILLKYYLYALAVTIDGVSNKPGKLTFTVLTWSSSVASSSHTIMG